MFICIYMRHLPPEQVFKHFCSTAKYCIKDEGVKLLSGMRQQNDTIICATTEIGPSVDNTVHPLRMTSKFFHKLDF